MIKFSDPRLLGTNG